MAERITSARSFAAFELPLSEVKAVGKRFGATVNDVLLSICDDAMQRYMSETGGASTSRMVCLMPVSTRREGDDSAMAAGATLVALAAPEATPAQRLRQITTVTRRVKDEVRHTSSLALQIQTLSTLASMELREQLPIGRGWVPTVANFTLSNISGGPERELFLGRARLVAFYAAPVVSGANAANFTLIPYVDKLCIGIGAARNLVADTARLATLAVSAWDELRTTTAHTRAA
jgi:hypothetical protein